MMVWIIILLVLFIISCIGLVFTTIGMLRGLKKTEYYEATLSNVGKRIFDTYIKMKDIDTLGAFEADDDVGIIFTELKTLINELQNYISEETNTENNIYG